MRSLYLPQKGNTGRGSMISTGTVRYARSYYTTLAGNTFQQRNTTSYASNAPINKG